MLLFTAIIVILKPEPLFARSNHPHNVV
jgi:hypothetical protein